MKYLKSFLLFVLILSCSQLSAQDRIDFGQEVKIAEKNTTFSQLVETLKASTGVNFSFSSAVISPDTPLLLSKTNYTLQEILDEACLILDIQHIAFNNKILFVELESTFEEFWIHGYIKDESSGEALIGAIIYNLRDFTGTETNEFGYFSLKISKPLPYLKASYLGFNTEYFGKLTKENRRLDIMLEPIFTIQEIIVTPYDSIDNHFWIEEVFDATAKSVNPSLFGEKDVLQSIKFLPGIQSGSEVQGNILVRGGSTDQNLMLMDGVPIYEVNHLLGLSSIFDEDAVNDVDVFTSGFSSKYGGRLSSVINVQIKNGNKFKYKGKASLGLLGAKFHAEGPLVKGRTSFNFSGRTSYINTLVKPIASTFLDLQDLDFGYRDLNLKFHHQLTKSSSISVSTYQGFDIIGFTNQTVQSHKSTNKITWANDLSNIRFNQNISDKLFYNISASRVNYSLNSRSSNVFSVLVPDQPAEFDSLEVFATSKITDNNLRTDWEYTQSNSHKISFGAGASNHIYNPAVISRKVVPDNINPNPSQGVAAVERFFYLEDKIDFSQYFSITSGFHFSQFLVDGEAFNSFQPRVKANIYFDPRNDLSFSYSRMTQFIHLLVNPGTGLPSDLWLPSTKEIAPEESLQYSAKYSRIWSKELITQIGAYYKEYDNLIEYRAAFPLYNPFINDNTIIPVLNEITDWEDRVVVGTGRSYGFDFFTSYQTKKVKTSLSYGYGNSTRVFPQINKGVEFPFKYDRRHDFSVSLSYMRNASWSYGVNWVYGTGYATTFPTTQLLAVDGKEILDFSRRNNFRLPDYHRLDVNMNYSRPINSKLTLNATLGIYNAYNRLNPYIVYLYNDKENDTFSPRQVSLFPILPFINLAINY